LHHSLTILGSGYTAKFLLPLAVQRYAHVFATSRDPDRHLMHLSADQRIRFDLPRPETWQAIPPSTDIAWCFPAVPIELVQQFADAASLRTRRLVVFGSTSAYDGGASDEYPPPWVDEAASIDPTKPRVQGEELLRASYGAIVLRVTGIYGPGRSPVEWIRTGRVNRSRKYVNLIHVEDLASSCLAALRHADSGGIYNISDGHPRTWMAICQMVEQRWNIQSADSQETDATGKRVSNKRMCELLTKDGIGLRYGDLFEALEQIRQNSLNEATPSP
jgi:nucleoside-diphosphate-sugar epimerase